MKKSINMHFVVLLLLGGAGFLYGAPTAANKQTPVVPAPAPYSVVGRDAHSRVWERTVYERGPSGQTVAQTHRYVELATGLNYWSNGQWQESQELIESFPGGAIARQGQHQVIFANHLAAAGAIDMQTPDGKRMRSQVLGLSYFDTASGQSVLIAEVKDSQGQLYPPNVVIYPDAFTDFKADVRYTYTRGGFEQDIILHERPPGPEVYGLDPATTKLQVLTEFLNSPKPGKRQASLKTRQGEVMDEELDFGVMKMGRGKAFSLGREDKDNPVSKQWLKLEGRDFLVEEVAVPDLEEELQALPAAEGASLNPAAGTARHVVSKQRLLPAMPLVRAGTNEMQLASLSFPAQGLVLDYQTLIYSWTNFTFQGDTTYYISGGFNSYGTNTFESGTVLKFATNGLLAINPGPPGTSVGINWKAGAYRPVICTAKDDNTVGESIGTGNPTGYYGNPMLALNGFSPQAPLNGLRISYAKTAIQSGGMNANFYNVQFVNCQNGLMLGGGSMLFANALFANTMTNFILQGGCTITAQNATFSASRFLATAPPTHTGSSLQFRNCILANVTNLFSGVFESTNGLCNGFYKSPVFGTSTVTNTFNPFQTVGAGSYYLTNGGNFFNQGTTLLDATLLAALKTKTTCPPIVYSNVTISLPTTLSPQAQRDTDRPDLGYHYDPIDYCFGGVLARSNLTVTAGTAVGWFYNWSGNSYGISLGDGVTAAFNGMATNPCVFARYNTVQEGGNGNWTSQGWLAGITDQSYAHTAPVISARFTRCAMLNSEGNVFRDNWIFFYINAVNCEFWTGGIGGYYASENFTNCLFFRDGAGLWWNYLPANLCLQDCTFIGGNVTADHTSGSVWPVTIANCAFDGTSFYMNAHGLGTTGAYCDYNAFLTNANLTAVMGGHEVTNLIRYNWQTSWLGNYYLPANSALINRGSTTADLVGLYHFTTQTNQVKETNSIVDIGYHYVAVDTNGRPIDSNGDGIPDYIADQNGNGIVDNGETPWLAAPVITTQPQSQTVCAGSTITFNVIATGSQLSYQWRKNGVNLSDGGNVSGSTTATLTLTGVSSADAADYAVYVSNPGGGVLSSDAVLALLGLPPIPTPPQSQTVNVGGNAQFNVVVAPWNGPFYYQWFFNSCPLSDGNGVSGSQTATLTLNNVQQAQMGPYYVNLDNCAGSVNSAIAMLTVGSVSGMWVYTGSLDNVRESHTATLLANGQVLVAGGGSDPNGYSFSSARRYNPATGTWINTGSMNTSREWAAATLLTNGQVLVTGGISWDSSGSHYLSSAELYNPATGTWTNTGSMKDARLWHTATLLPNGQVLVVGGNLEDYLSPAEVYNPATGTWTQTGPMYNYEVFECHTATLLANGQVLVAGGDDGWNYVLAGELYNPATGTWTVTGSLNQGRELHTATLLTNGQVLVAAGGNADGNLSSAELYNPATRKWTLTGSLNSARSIHMATLLPNGQALVAGGVGQYNDSYASAELFDPATGTWVYTGSMNEGHSYATMTLLTNGQAMVVGGQNYNLVATAELYATLPLPVITTQPQSQAVCAGSTVSFNVIATGSPLSYQWQKNDVNLSNGGNVSGTTTATLTLTGVSSADAASYTVMVSKGSGSVFSQAATLTVSAPPVITTQPQSQTANAGNNVQLSVVAGGATPFSYQWYFAGNALADGGGISGSQTATLMLSNVQQGQAGAYYVVVGNCGGLTTSASATLTVIPMAWTYTGSLNVQREFHTANLLANGQVLVVGGYDGDSSAELYNPATWMWTLTGSMNVPRSQGFTATMLPNGQVLVTGGEDQNGSIPSAELYDPATGTWTVTGSMNTTRQWHTATLLPNGQVLVAGGDSWIAGTYQGNVWTGSMQCLSSAELYNPATGTWSYTGSMSTAHESHTATLLTNGQVLIAGGDDFINYLTDSEVYNPASGTWTVTGSVNTPRDCHTATLLPNGQVLIAGGENVISGNQNTLSSAELYNPATGTWTATGSMNTAREYLMGTLLANGQVLVAGGDGGYIEEGYTSAELYNPATGTWTPAASMHGGRDWATMTLLANGWVLVAGGQGYDLALGDDQVGYTDYSSKTTAEIYMPLSSSSRVIEAQPQSQTVCAGSTVSFNVVAAGLQLSYQWQKNGVNLPSIYGDNIYGAITPTLTLTGVSSADVASYTVMVSNGSDPVYSQAATLTLSGPPAITTQPQSQTTIVGNNVQLSVVAGGTTPFSYQWYFAGNALADGGGISGSQTATLALNNIQPGQAGAYYVVVGNCGGSTTSANATLTVNPVPNFTIFTVLHTFTATSSGRFDPQVNNDGARPQAGLIPSGNTLYGTAMGGGTSGAGTVFKVNTDGTGFTTVHDFTGSSDGGDPQSGLVLSGNTLYGTTYSGGSSGEGTVFKVNTDGTGFTALHAFSYSGSDGVNPAAGLILSGNTLYGTTVWGGSSGEGTVFKINTDGTGFTILYSFTGGSDGTAPTAGLILSGNTLYGTANEGGSSGDGTVFKINTDGTGFTTLHGFTALPDYPDPYVNSDGAYPDGRLILLGNTLYGTASNGGSSAGGTIFKVNTDGTGFTTVYNFTGGSGGLCPQAGLISSGNTLYGTAYGGSPGGGMVFAVNTDGTGFTTLYNFTFGSDGINPEYAELILLGTTLYGTTANGGCSDLGGNNGTVFCLPLTP